LLGSSKTSSGNRYSSPAVPKFTRIKFRPRFSTALTKVPSRGRRTPVFWDRMGLTVFNESPGLMAPSVVSLTAVRLLLVPRRLLTLTIGTFFWTPLAYFLDVRNEQSASIVLDSSHRSNCLCVVNQANLVPLLTLMLSKAFCWLNSYNLTTATCRRLHK
jgi:hypothetical protein